MKRRTPSVQRETPAVNWPAKAEAEARPAERRQLVKSLVDRQRMLEDADIRIAALEHRLSLLTAQLHSVQTSKSWKLTRPLRALFEALRRGRKGQPASDPRMVTAEETFGSRDLDYDRWLSLHDRLDSTGRQNVSRRILSLSHKPLVTIVMQCRDTEGEWVDASIASVRDQLYPKWELLLLGAPGSRNDVIHHDRQTTDPRIRPLEPGDGQERNCRALDAAASQARGEYVVSLRAGDVLDERALFAVVEAIDRDPEIALLYADDDEIKEGEQRTAPVFKPDWSPDLLYSSDFLTGLIACRTSLLREVGGSEGQFPDLWAYDLHLRLVEILPSHRIRHLPTVLYHRRQRPTRDNESDQPRWKTMETAPLQAHFARRGVEARVHIDLPRRSRSVAFGIGAKPPLVSVVVPTKDHVDLLRCCVEGLLNATNYPDLELLIVDNQSLEEETFQFFDQVDKDPRVRILQYDHPYNFSAINNYAVSRSSGELVALVNCDIEFTKPDWLTLMAGHALRPEIGAVGPLLLYPSGQIQSAGIILGVGGVAANRLRGRRVTDPFYDQRPLATRNISAVSGALLLLRRAVFDEVGGLDERLAVAFNDVDLCLRIYECGYLNLWTAQAVAIHHESQLLKRHDSPERAAQFGRAVSLMQARWGHLLAADPFYNRNLSLEVDRDYELACPPRAPISLHT